MFFDMVNIADKFIYMLEGIINTKPTSKLVLSQSSALGAECRPRSGARGSIPGSTLMLVNDLVPTSWLVLYTEYAGWPSRRVLL